jgi:hypothetical protein
MLCFAQGFAGGLCRLKDPNLIACHMPSQISCRETDPEDTGIRNFISIFRLVLRLSMRATHFLHFFVSYRECTRSRYTCASSFCLARYSCTIIKHIIIPCCSPYITRSNKWQRKLLKRKASHRKRRLESP